MFFIDINSTILSGISIGDNCIVGQASIGVTAHRISTLGKYKNKIIGC